MHTKNKIAMKNALNFLILVMLTAGLTSCELADVDIDTNLTGQLNIVTDAAELKSTEESMNLPDGPRA